MKCTLDFDTAVCNVTREAGDRPLRNESHLMYRIKECLKAQGYDVIKKAMAKEGHLVSEHVYYVRSRQYKKADAFAIYDELYATRDACQALRQWEHLQLRLICDRDYSLGMHVLRRKTGGAPGSTSAPAQQNTP
jgi:hypothetical protein